MRAPVCLAFGSSFLTTLSQRAKGEREWSGTTGARRWFSCWERGRTVRRFKRRAGLAAGGVRSGFGGQGWMIVVGCGVFRAAVLLVGVIGPSLG